MSLTKGFAVTVLIFVLLGILVALSTVTYKLGRDHAVKRIRIAIVGVGNCASSLIQGIHYYRRKNPDDAVGLMHWTIGGYKPGDI